MNNATDNQPLTDRIDRLTPEGRIAWHVEAAMRARRRALVSVLTGRMAA